MTEGWVDYLTGPYGFIFAFGAGLLSFLSPCVLPLVPAYLAHLTGTAVSGATRWSRRDTISHALVFVAGFGLVFTIFGASVGLLSATLGSDSSYALRDRQDLLAKVGAVFLIVMGLNLVGVIRIPWLYRTYSLDALTAPAVVGGGGGVATMTLGGGAVGGGGTAWSGLGYAKSLGVGATFALGWTPCIGPVLGAIFGLAIESASVAKGTYLLAVYSLGLGLPFIVTSFAVVPVTSFLRRFQRFLPLVEVVMGALVIFVGALIFLDELTIFNRYFDFFGFSQI